MARNLITHDQLVSLLDYNPLSGKFTWLRPTYRQLHIGKEAGSKNMTYVEIRIYGRIYLAHRLAFFYMTRRWPKDQIDHINLDKKDNRWTNLREADNFQNSANKAALRTNACGLKGVRANHCSKDKPWRADIFAHGKSTCLGTFHTKEEAHAAYRGAAKVLRGEFARY